MLLQEHNSAQQCFGILREKAKLACRYDAFRPLGKNVRRVTWTYLEFLNGNWHFLRRADIAAQLVAF